jgi:hypothetical protein
MIPPPIAITTIPIIETGLRRATNIPYIKKPSRVRANPNKLMRGNAGLDILNRSKEIPRPIKKTEIAKLKFPKAAKTSKDMPSIIVNKPHPK